MKEKGEPTINIQKQLFTLYGRKHNLEKLLQMKEVGRLFYVIVLCLKNQIC